METAKTVSESRTEQIQIIMPTHINGFDRLFGGQLVEWIDIVARSGRTQALQPQRHYGIHRQPALQNRRPRQRYGCARRKNHPRRQYLHGGAG